LQAVEGRLRDDANHLLWRMGFYLSVWLIGMAGIGFVIASGYLALDSLLGAGWAAVLLGLVLIALAGGGLALTAKRKAKAPAAQPAPVPDPEPAPVPASPVPAGAASAEASTVAFTAAFVLGRYLTRERHDGDGSR
jgi:hypothetical protein